MTGQPKHCTSEQLHLLLDGRGEEGERKAIEGHLQECPRCTGVYRAIGHLDQGLRALPVAATSAGFTKNLMDKALPAGHLSLGFRIVENLAYLFAVLIVTGIITAVFLATGVIDSGQVSEGQGVVSTYAEATSNWMAEVIRGGTTWLERYFPAKGGVNIMAFGIAILAALALLDRLLHRRFAHRTR